MPASRSWLGVFLALAALPAPAAAQAVGSEFQVNTYTTGDQRTRSYGHDLIAADASGNFVVVWHGRGPSDAYGIFGQRYDSAGSALGAQFLVNSDTTSDQSFPAIASDASGNFVVVWASYAQDGSHWGIFGQRYDSAGVPQGGEFLVNSYTRGEQFAPSVAMDAAGEFVVVWDGYLEDGSGWGVFGQRFDSLGGALGNEFQVDSYTTSSQRFSSVASDAAGNFVVVWSSEGQDGDSYGIFGQRYDSGGVAQGDEVRVSSYTSLNQWFPDVAMDASGNFVVVWEDSTQDGDSYGIFGQRYDSAGAALGGEFQVNSYTPDGQFSPSIASDATGNFVVTWGSYGQDGSSFGVFGQAFDSGGVPQGAEFQINSYATDRQWLPSVEATGINRFVVAWESLGQDGSSYGVFGQRYGFGADTTPPSVAVEAPNGGEKVFAGSAYLIRWVASDDIALSSFDVFVSADSGESFAPIAECQGLPGAATSCLWLAPGPLTLTALIRVDARDTSGNSASDESDATFKIHAGTAKLTVASPNANLKWRIGSVRTIKWMHNLGNNSHFRIELDRNDDGTFEELIAAGAPASTPTRGGYAWTVTGPVTTTARVRISWTGNPAISDSSDVTFQIRPAQPGGP